ncbi:hypothetical protein MCG98_04795 [Ruminococcus sp. OA3]|uniref:hypothetical protein n=1 Tax=Ruminococcus sp. OA3 TaxID=2914164 RepID=UPI001F053B98|nr:hypothetical protein [Ruminococcus sp. OA3]MCH1981889.1 hypothetical protein [Ruminococcus sp. OA3]
MGKKKKKKDETLLNELKAYQAQGVLLMLNGRPSTPKAIMKAHCIAEDGAYMRDYVQNEEGRVETLQFDLIIKK